MTYLTIFFVLIELFIMCIYATRFANKTNLKTTYLILFLLCIILVIFNSIHKDDHESLIFLFKIFCFFSSISYAAIYKKNAIFIMLIILFSNSINYYLIDFQYNKYAAIPISLVSILTFLFFNKRTIKFHLIFILVVFDLFQALAIGFRTLALYSLLILFIIISLRFLRFKFHYNLFIKLFILSTILLYFLGLSYFEFKYALLPPTSSNIERISMLFWLIIKIPDYFLIAPSHDAFNEGYSLLMSTYNIYPEKPTVPHNFFFMFFLKLGFLGALIFIYLIHQILKNTPIEDLKNKGEINLWALISIYGIILFIFNPFDSYSRLIVGLSFGLMVYLYNFEVGRGRINP